MTRPAAKADNNPSGIIKVGDYSEFFNSASWKRTRAKALAYDPLKGAKHIAKAPPSPNSGEHAGKKIAKKANFFVGSLKAEKKPSPKKPVAKTAPVKVSKPAPKLAKSTPRSLDTIPVRFDYFNSPSFKKARDYQPKWKKHVAQVPPMAKTYHAELLKKSKLAKRPVRPKPQPSLTASYVARPGQTPQFEPARVVKNQAQLNDLLRKGNLDLLSAIAYCDRRGEVHTGSVLEIYSMLPG